MKQVLKKLLVSLFSSTILAVSLQAAPIRLNINNTFITSAVAPIQQSGTTLVPLRVVSENLGADVKWDASTQQVTIIKDETQIKLYIGNKTVDVNGTNKTLSVALQTINGTTMVPIRFVSENLDCSVKWENGIVSVVSSGSSQVASKDETKQISKDIYPYNGKSYRIIQVDGGDRSGIRQNNVAVDIGFGNRTYWGLTNEYGQLVYVIADKVILQNDKTEPVNSNGRYYNDEANVRGTERPDLDQGHVIADSLGGVSNAYNITPQNSTLNRHGDQAYMEKVIRDAGGCTNFVATITYPNTSTQIPSSYKYEYTVMGNKIVDEFPNLNPEGSLVDKAQETGKPTEITIPTTNTPKPVGSSFNEKAALAKIDTNRNGKVTIKEAKAAGYKMPVTSDHWLYKYMDDGDGDGMVGE